MTEPRPRRRSATAIEPVLNGRAGGRAAGQTDRQSDGQTNGRANGHRAPARTATKLAEPRRLAGVNGVASPAVPRRAASAEPRSSSSRSATRNPAQRAARPAPAANRSGRRGGAGTAAGPSREPDVWDHRVAGALAFLRRRITGHYDVDQFGFDPDLTDHVLYPVLRLLYQHYFRVETTGVAHLPRDGAALIVANHSGTIPVDALMLSLAVYDETPLHRHLRLLGADLVFRLPILSEMARKAGSTLACNPDAERLLRAGEYVGVFPEGFKGIGKPYHERYKLQRFGRGGFVSAALRTGTPIVPAAIVGAEEIYPIVGNIKPLARVAGLPYLPVTPLFPWLGPIGMLPLPSKWLIEFGEPIDTAPYADEVDDPIVVFNLADQVRETVQHTLHRLLERRPDPFS